jgi:GNAT superfamily N-acetyltransferase
VDQHDRRESVAAPSLSVETVRTRRQLNEFLRFPWTIYRGDPNWVAPLLAQQRALLDRRKHPFHEHAEVEYFLARRGGKVVGRIAAIVNQQHIRFHGEQAGFFGFFEAIDDQAVAQQLLAASGAWLRARGMTVQRGPANFSSNEEFGLLVDGFDGPPVIMMTYNPPYYERLLEGCGLVKAKDLLAYWTDRDPDRLEQFAKLTRVVERISKRVDLTLRPVNLKRFDEELLILKRIYNRAWQLNWGFVPFTDAEIEYAGHQLKSIIDPDLCTFAFVGDEPVGVVISVPDYNVALKRVSGRLLPLGFLKIVWYTRVRKIRRVRLMLLGVVQDYQKRGIDAALVASNIRTALTKGYHDAEFGWVLEDNKVLLNALDSWGLKPYRRYRVYEVSL